MIPPEACYLGWQESLALLAKLVEAEIRDWREAHAGSRVPIPGRGVSGARTRRRSRRGRASAQSLVMERDVAPRRSLARRLHTTETW